ncbi:Intracellular septation protein IspA [hydrothermal vent metagenome]|uniref:Intracellular septation protein IspA n=1 Tax=hydrothermal vent metagenome TaxID=652676 RepID=A0A3B0ZX71_9ZZZZ
MKLLYDFFPILLFFIAYKLYGIYAATVVAIAASFVQVGGYWLKYRRFENMHLLTLALLVVFGGLTLFLQDEAFIKWKPSVINWLFGLVFLGSQFIGKKTIVERMMGASIEIPATLWPRINLAWSAFFIFLGFANMYVMYNFDTDTWVNFKLFGMTGLTLVFVLGQGLYLIRYMKNQPATETKRD